MIKSISLLIFFIIFTYLSDCNEKYIQYRIALKDIILLPEEFNDKDKILIDNLNQNIIYAIYNQIHKDSSYYYIKVLELKENETIKLLVPEYLSDNSAILSDFKVFNNYIALLFYGKSLLIFENNKLIYEFKDSYYKHLKFIDSNLYAFSRDIYDGTKILNINLNNLKFNEYKDVVEFENNDLLFTLFQPRKLIDISNNIIINSAVTSYNFNILNLNFEKYDPKIKPPQKWRKNETESLAIEDVNLKDAKILINKIRPFTKTMSLIHRVDFLDDYLLVLWSNPSNRKQYDFMFSLYKRSNEKFDIIEESMINKEFDLNSNDYFYNKNWHINNTYKLSTDLLYQIEPIPIEINKQNPQTINQLQDESQEYFKKNSLRYSVILLEIRSE